MRPNLIIAGVNKGGTTSLFRYLSRHPDVCPSDVKETCFFLPLRYGKDLPPVSQYEDHFRKCRPETIRLEATPGYFYGGRAVAEAIDNTVEDANIVIVLREPVSRFLSFLEFMKSELLIDRNMSAAAYLDACRAMSAADLKKQDKDPYFGLEGGCYSNYIGDWIDVFGDRLTVHFFEDMAADPSLVLKDVAATLGLSASPFDKMDFSIENKTRGFRNRAVHRMAIGTYKKLGRHFLRNHAIHRTVRGLYFSMNGSDRRTPVDEAFRDRLAEFYAPYNRALRDRLTGSGVVRGTIPAWLAAANADAA